MRRMARDRFIAKPSVASPRNASSVAVVSFVRNEELFGVFDKIVSILKVWWPKKTAACVAHIAHVSERAVQFWLARETGLSLENVIALLRTKAGFQILEALMGDCQEEWWLTVKIAHALEETRRQINAQQRRIDRLRAERDQIEMNLSTE